MPLGGCLLGFRSLDVTDTGAFRDEFLEGLGNPAPPVFEIHKPPLPGEHCRLGDPL
jgi:hypothetical protein